MRNEMVLKVNDVVLEFSQGGHLEGKITCLVALLFYSYQQN